MEKQQLTNASSTEEDCTNKASGLVQNHISNPMLLSDNAIQLFPIHQEMEILMEEQYIKFLNEDTIQEPTKRTNAFITALLCLQNVLLPEEDVEEIEISLVSEKESKIHALLLSVEQHFCDAQKVLNGSLDVFPSSWRVCLRRNKNNGNMLCLDMSEYESHMGLKMNVHHFPGDKLENNYLPLSKEIWDDNKKELKLGLGWLQLLIVQPSIQPRIFHTENNSMDLKDFDRSNTSSSINVTLCDVLLQRYMDVMLEKHKFLNIYDSRLQDMIKMFKEEELLSSSISPSKIRAMTNRYGRKKDELHKKRLSKEEPSNKSKCLERICLESLYAARLQFTCQLSSGRAIIGTSKETIFARNRYDLKIIALQPNLLLDNGFFQCITIISRQHIPDHFNIRISFINTKSNSLNMETVEDSNQAVPIEELEIQKVEKMRSGRGYRVYFSTFCGPVLQSAKERKTNLYLQLSAQSTRQTSSSLVSFQDNALIRFCVAHQCSFDMNAQHLRNANSKLSTADWLKLCLKEASVPNNETKPSSIHRPTLCSVCYYCLDAASEFLQTTTTSINDRQLSLQNIYGANEPFTGEQVQLRNKVNGEAFDDSSNGMYELSTPSDSRSISSRSRLSSYSSLATSSMEEPPSSIPGTVFRDAKKNEESKNQDNSLMHNQLNGNEHFTTESKFLPITPPISSSPPISSLENNLFSNDTLMQEQTSDEHQLDKGTENVVAQKIENSRPLSCEKILPDDFLEENDCDVFDQYMKEIYATGVTNDYENDEEKIQKLDNSIVHSSDKEYRFARNIFSPSLKSIWNTIEKPISTDSPQESQEQDIFENEAQDSIMVPDKSLDISNNELIANIEMESEDIKPIQEDENKDETTMQYHDKNHQEKETSVLNAVKYATVGTNTDPHMVLNQCKQPPNNFDLKGKEKETANNDRLDREGGSSGVNIDNRIRLRNGLRRFCGTFSVKQPLDGNRSKIRINNERNNSNLTKPHFCHLKKSIINRSLLFTEILQYVEDFGHHYTRYFGNGERVQSAFFLLAVLLMYFFFIYRWFEVFYRLILIRIIRGCRVSPKESKMIIGCIVVVLAARSYWYPYSSLVKEILFCLVLMITGIGVLIVSPYSYHQNWKRIRCGNVDDFIDFAWLVSSILAMRQLLECGWNWWFALLVYNSVPWIKRELKHIYSDCSDDVTELFAMLPDITMYFPVLDRAWPSLETALEKTKKVLLVTVSGWQQMPLWGRVGICLLPSFTYEGGKQMLFSTCIGFATLYKYAQIEEKWTLRLSKRIKQMESIEDILVGQPFLIWSAYTYSTALGTSSSLWICLVFEEFRCEMKHVVLIIENGYSKLFPNHKLNWRVLKLKGKNMIQKLCKIRS